MKTNSRRARTLLAALLTLAGLVSRAAAINNPPKLLEQQTDAAHVAYSLDNPFTASPKFDITLFAVSIPQTLTPQDPIAPANWSAQVLTLADWSQPIGGVSSRPSWASFTGRSFTSVFAASDSVLGYYVAFAPAANGTWSYIPQDPIKPGQALAGFSRSGTAASAFLAAGPSDSSTFTGDTHDATTQGVGAYQGTATVVPEPASALLLLVGAGLLGRRRARPY